MMGFGGALVCAVLAAETRAWFWPDHDGRDALAALSENRLPGAPDPAWRAPPVGATLIAFIRRALRALPRRRCRAPGGRPARAHGARVVLDRSLVAGFRARPGGAWRLRHADVRRLRPHSTGNAAETFDSDAMTDDGSTDPIQAVRTPIGSGSPAQAERRS